MIQHNGFSVYLCVCLQIRLTHLRSSRQRKSAFFIEDFKNLRLCILKQLEVISGQLVSVSRSK
ncbi:Uncharacterised protein [Vibrio cholerae]|uniref:Uncharacterized protein n=1 Tax=Vibrio cholerae TaxID=666 RepID=A0A655Z882_VIBCL|nr:Uncharacterised protein [Vibrio cholerae]CSB45640.1 Uncharacterised protein [Vibrio cholerae]CSC63671.1 Uncharacterised protein [Vibrio cholerae]CSC78971.1 Uncharacterised protein [Vibrio cholerae]